MISPIKRGRIKGSPTKAVKSRFAGIRYNAVAILPPENDVQAALMALVGTRERRSNASVIIDLKRIVTMVKTVLIDYMFSGYGVR